MSKTQYYTAMSLDGFLATEDHSLDWLLQFGMPGDSHERFLREVGAVAMGSHTYEWILRRHGPESPDPQPWFHSQPTWIFTSRQLPRWPDADLRFVAGDVRPAHQQMVADAGGKNIWIMGGGDLAGQFSDARLLDELILSVAPVTLGRGTPFLPRRIAQPSLRLVSVQQLDAAFVELRYALPDRL